MCLNTLFGLIKKILYLVSVTPELTGSDIPSCNGSVYTSCQFILLSHYLLFENSVNTVELNPLFLNLTWIVSSCWKCPATLHTAAFLGVSCEGRFSLCKALPVGAMKNSVLPLTGQWFSLKLVVPQADKTQFPISFPAFSKSCPPTSVLTSWANFEL